MTLLKILTKILTLTDRSSLFRFFQSLYYKVREKENVTRSILNKDCWAVSITAVYK